MLKDLHFLTLLFLKLEKKEGVFTRHLRIRACLRILKNLIKKILKEKGNLVIIYVCMLTAIRRPISTDTKKTPRKAPKHARKSNLSIFQISHAARRSIKDRTAEMMIAERMQFGVYLNKGVSTNKTTSTTMAIIMLDIAV